MSSFHRNRDGSHSRQKWMLDFIVGQVAAEKKIAYNPEILRLYPSADWTMHDGCHAATAT